MARNPSRFAKMQREQARRRRRAERQQRKDERRAEKAQEAEAAGDGVDPDIAHIVPGPQPLPWEEEPAEEAVAEEQSA